MRHLEIKHLRELAQLCGGVALLVIVALSLSGAHNNIVAQNSSTSQAASTWLADQQGILPYANGQAYPAYTLCAVNASCQNYGCSGGYCGALPQCNDMPQSNICNGGEQPSYPSYEQFWSGVFSMHPPASTAGQTQYAYSYWPGTIPPGVGTAVSSYGSAPSVSAGGQITLEWSCQPSREVDKMSHQSGSWQNLGSLMSTGAFATSATGGGSGFSTGGAIYGSQTITAPAAGGTYPYTLLCNINPAVFGTTYPTMTIYLTVVAVDNCPTATATATTQHGSGLQLTSGTHNVKVQGYDFCVTNNSSTSIFIPTNTSTEVGDFYSATQSYLASTVVSFARTPGF